jgi:ribosome-binding factor A
MARTPFDRTARVNSLLRQVLAELLEFEVKDPRTRGLTLTDVEVTGDLREAKVYVCGPPELDRDAALVGLKRASGFLRREVGNRIRLRATPQLHFFYDESLDYGARIEARLRDLGLGDAAEDDDADASDDDGLDEADDDGSAGS